ncbi:hypothetical protein NSK_005841 [Nannochloropsis salina CCMP1776]|uniref:Uncharacterized protein n=1 Tax=Nannochloropsis salina CCMP1776 TaxID=1027361 RepID=A0A4D9CW59_9STRA|nr:hypothetical protein NSK_005841 [Nannochloropsis salina CCMP1776]|eukprot:TFJ82834.1 hypothetical protein NSK_005841 [Nannochloropsis salina CCMP1776]
MATQPWPYLERLDASLDLKALGVVGHGLRACRPHRLQHLTLRLLFRPTAEEAEQEVEGGPLAAAIAHGHLRSLVHLALLPEELRFEVGAGEEVPVSEMVWIQTDALSPVFDALASSSSLSSLAVGEFLSPLSFAAMNKMLRARGSEMRHLRLGRLNGDELMPQLMELAHMLKEGAFPSLRTFHLNDLSSSPSLFPHSRSGRLELLRVLLEEGIRKGGVLARLEDLSLRNTGVTSADFEDLLYARCLPSLVHLSLGNESESLIYNFNCVGWPAMQALRRIGAARASPSPPSSSVGPLFPRLQTLNLHGNRLSPFGASQLLTSLVKHRVMPALRRLDVRNTHIGAGGLGSVLKILSLRAPPPSPSSSFPATTPTSPPLGTLRHLYVSLTHGKDEERQLETVQALLLQASQSLPRLRMLAILDEGEILDADTENRLKVRGEGTRKGEEEMKERR